MLLAEGAVDACVESVANHWDLAAPKLIVEEAGGRFTDFRGAPTVASGEAIASNGHLHDVVLARLGATGNDGR
jgi:histidinol-phosphatase